MKEINAMVQDPSTYIESIGRHDRLNVAEAIADQGTGTTLRVCFGVSGEKYPLRALGYYSSALAIQERYMPEAHLQFVFPMSTAEKFNNVYLGDHEAYMTKMNLEIKARNTFGRQMSHYSPNRLSVEEVYDGELPDEALIAAVDEVISADTGLKGVFAVAASKRSVDFSPYVAAHVLMHDTNPRVGGIPEIEMVADYVHEYPMNRRVISIGAQSERPFYVARMACQKAGILPEDKQVATGQIFTQHVLPPYLSCREGEPLLPSESLVPSEIVTVHPVRSVQRDLEYLKKIATEEITRYHEMTEIREISEYCVGRILVRQFK